MAFFQWPQQIMNSKMAGGGADAPYSCEIDSINAAALEACDGLDGVVDGVVSEPEECLRVFDPLDMVGKVAQRCQITGGGGGGSGSSNAKSRRSGKVVKISATAAAVVKGMWQGMVTTKQTPVYHGVFPPADITGNDPLSYPLVGLAATTCQYPLASGWAMECKGKPYQSGEDWMRLLVAKDANFNLEGLSHEEWDSLVRQSQREYKSVIGSAETDLSRFKQAGGKIMSFHGLVSLSCS